MGKEVPSYPPFVIVSQEKAAASGAGIRLCTHNPTMQNLVPYLPHVFCLLAIHGIFMGAVSLHGLPCLVPWLLGESGQRIPAAGMDCARGACLVGHWNRSRRSGDLWPGRVEPRGTGPAGQAHNAPADHTKSGSVENLGPRLWKHQKRRGWRRDENVS